MEHDVWTEDRKPNKETLLIKIKKISLIRFLFGKKRLKKTLTPSLAEKTIIECTTTAF